jgi:hypothetical protein
MYGLCCRLYVSRPGSRAVLDGGSLVEVAAERQRVSPLRGRGEPGKLPTPIGGAARRSSVAIRDLPCSASTRPLLASRSSRPFNLPHSLRAFQVALHPLSLRRWGSRYSITEFGVNIKIPVFHLGDFQAPADPLQGWG